MKSTRHVAIPLALLIAGATLCVTMPAQARQPRFRMDRVLSISDRARAALPAAKKRQALQRFGLKAVALRRSFVKRHNPSYKVEIPSERSPQHRIQNQRKSGRCWAFATDKVLESKLHKKGFTQAAVSPSFINYYSLYHKAMTLLVTSAKLKGKHSPAAVNKLLGEGGTGMRAVEVVKRHGVVPESKMPTSVDGANSGVFLNQLKRLVASAKQDFARVPDGKTSAKQRTAVLKQYRGQVKALLSATVGKPPRRFKVDGQWYTPRTYASKYLGLTATDLDYVVLGNDPTKGWNRRYKVPGLGMSYERYNVSSKVLQAAVKRTIRGGEAVYFSTNVSADNPHRVAKGDNIPREAQGILSLKAFNYDAFIPTAHLSKRRRVASGISGANHAMALTGYDPVGRGVVRKWKVDNSWGNDIGDRGHLHMYGDFFKAYVREVVVPRSVVPKAVLKKLEARPVFKPKKVAPKK